MVDLVVCKNKKKSIKNEGIRVFTTLYITISDPKGQITSESVVVSGKNLNSSKLSCMYVHVTCKNEYESIKNEGAIVVTTFLIL